VLVTFAVFAATSARTITGEDCGELVAAAHLLGVAHPPGYPLWCLLAKAATYLPIGEIAFRVALVSALFGALTIGAIGAIILMLSASWPAAIAASIGFGLMRDQWSQSTIAEVYTLNTFFLAACILLLILWSERLSWRLFNLFALSFGLSLTNHLTMLGAAPPFLLFMLMKGWRLIPKWRQLLVGTGCFLVGLFPYAYLPLAAARNPEVNWGNPVTLSAVIAHVKRSQYTDGIERPPLTWDRVWLQLSVLWNSAAGQGAMALLIVGTLGIIVLCRRRFALGAMLGTTVLMSTVVLILYINLEPDFENGYASRLFFVPAYLALAIAAGWLVGAGLRRLPRRAGLVASAVAVIGAIVPPFVSNLKECDYSQYRIVAAHGRRLLMSIPLNAVVFPSSDHNTFPLIYLRFVEGLRPDVTIADKYGYIEPSIANAAPFSKGLAPKSMRTKDFRAAIEAWVVDTWNRPVYFSTKGRVPSNGKWDLVSEGLWYRARPREFPAEARAAADAAAWGAIEATPGDEDPSPHDYTARMILADLAFARARRAMAQGDVDGAIALCDRAAVEVPGSKEVLNNLGSLIAEHGEHGRARPFFERAAALDPKYLTAAKNLALTFHAERKHQEARKAFNTVLDLDVYDPPSNRAMAQIAKAEEAWGEAAHYLEMVGKIESDARAFRDAGLICLYELKELKNAKALLQASLTLDRNQPEIADIERNIKRAGKADGSEDGRSEPDDPKRTGRGDPAARGTPGRGFGEPTIAEPTAPDPLRALLPKPAAPTAPGLPDAGSRTPSPRPPNPNPGGGR
jgi:Tfp pilus assembly protein PilF